MIRSCRILMIGVVAMALAGCEVFRSGVAMDAAMVNHIQRNVTTRAQVEEMFGPPMDVQIIVLHERLLKYWFKQVYDNGVLPLQTPDIQTRHQMLLLWIGEDNVVKDYEFTDYVTDKTVEGSAEVVRRAAVTTQPGQKPKWYLGGDE